MLTCPVCKASEAFTFSRRHGVPVHQNLIVADAAAARNVTRGTLELDVCLSCGFVWNAAFDLGLLSYGREYDNTQSCSHYFEAYLDGLVERLVDTCGVRSATIVEVGCGKGHFLRKLLADEGAGNRGFGFDPSYVGPDALLDGRLRFERRYYDASCAHVQADVVVCRHVIEHVPSPLELLGAIRSALTGSPGARLFVETPCVEWILRHRVVWDFFYEHCSLFTASSLSRACEAAGFEVRRVDHVFGGQYLFLEAQVAGTASTSDRPSSGTAELAMAYSAAEDLLIQRWLGKMRGLRERGKVALWGAGAKGATLANLLDPDCTLIDCVVDLNPNKQGHFVPGTGHVIIPPHELSARAVRTAVLMNPNYRDENTRILAEAMVDVELIDWSDDEAEP